MIGVGKRKKNGKGLAGKWGFILNEGCWFQLDMIYDASHVLLVLVMILVLVLVLVLVIVRRLDNVICEFACRFDIS
jgi:hypothetical protein